ncbi:Monoterpene epsilon-lactone hydrolase [Defluviimonas aquaemixtae]|uniref:Monoterpene epsilon-lactone hydrolase n=1 Tax=Albidovulum aquaemixtae TaxID=1542388 RepID=A0A2R8B2P8_9RHOB|nr:alpha/beta hydrolase [Defluviimonas aquaemixtae]SPH16906.1 Monoterpene epsilon-lactone hydrolase [Defluviimonas aquaemixtae]
MSLRLRLLKLMIRTIVKPRLRATRDPLTARREFEFSARRLLAGPRGTAMQRIAADPPVPPLTWFTPDRVEPSAALLYFHGGGYTAGSPMTHRGIICRLARRIGVPACAPEYRLAPEHRFPAAQDDALAAWCALVRQGLRPRRIVLAGDSAGGGLALSLLAQLCRRGTPPAAAAVFSAWTDMTGSGASCRDNAGSDPFLPAERMPDLVRFALGDHPPEDPRASPLFADFPGCPPVLFQVSAREILFDDSRRFAERLKCEGVEAELQVWPDTPHAWPVFAGRIPEADAALKSAAEFLRASLVPCCA